MDQITVTQAIDLALAEEMRRDPRVLAFGEGVARPARPPRGYAARNVAV
jgi:pyruvate/2-oxoglutarate/acetoin dehydrogenase E1 component